MYDIEFSTTAEKQLYKLERGVQIRVISTLERIRIKPYSFVKKLVGSPYFRLRIGDYRAILDIQDGRLIVFVIEVANRRDVYK
ncbi:type II toxin-antitoxin system RelE/ParE family toxin [Candidatus Woesearchaeota archaeon]|nr:type II toxin-antitoxin system RelE/ParE family toxin [Candidatus Woesearchaeota archaeon]